MKQRRHAAAVRQLLAELPSVENAVGEANVVDDLLELLLAVCRQHDVVEREHRLDALGEVRQALGGHLLAGGHEAVEAASALVIGRLRAASDRHGLFDSHRSCSGCRETRLRACSAVEPRAGESCGCQRKRSACAAADSAGPSISDERHRTQQPRDARRVGANHTDAATRSRDRGEEQLQRLVGFRGRSRRRVTSMISGATGESRRSPEAYSALLDLRSVEAHDACRFDADRRATRRICAPSSSSARQPAASSPANSSHCPSCRPCSMSTNVSARKRSVSTSIEHRAGPRRVPSRAAHARVARPARRAHRESMRRERDRGAAVRPPAAGRQRACRKHASAPGCRLRRERHAHPTVRPAARQ